ncbi:MAG TPA: carboxypeptidase-like regulatory domain-containing protein [Pyrinomonadaceae bacterium]|jgi:hypothetical protein|nr:carboxypeptidase-like regulatory domain-containing protein [Pyrinomonadaceae bacterium]
MKIIAGTLSLFFITLCFTLAAPVTFAATFIVSTANDTADLIPGDGNCVDNTGQCSLRAAISEANAFAGDDIITLPAGTYTQVLAAANEDNNAGGDWDIGTKITINGAGESSTILQAAAAPDTATERVLEISINGTLTLSGVTIRHGFKPPSGSSTNFGGGIRNRGWLFLSNSTVTLNTAPDGGGIHNGHFLSLSGVTVSNNSCVTTTTLCAGGGIHSSAASGLTIIIHNSLINDNSATSSGANPIALGAGMMSDSADSYLLEIVDSQFNQNKGIGNSAGGGVRINASSGAVTANITNTTFNNNFGTSTRGGGISVFSGGTGGISGTWDRLTINGNTALQSGGLEITGVGGSTNINLLNSTISGNSVSTKGGGIYLSDINQGPAASNITLNMVNDTVSGNISGGNGGGVMVEQFISTGNPNVIMNFCTVARNRANEDNSGADIGGGLLLSPNFGTISIKNSIVADNILGGPGTGTDMFGPVASQDFNHVENPGANFAAMPNDTTGFDPQLGALQDNGGPTLTQLLGAASPLLDTIPSGVNDCGSLVSNDQRIFSRPFNGSCDKGATELGGLAPGPWALSGVVKTTTGMPIRNVQVTISGGNLPSPMTVFTGNLGTYQFTNLIGNEYTVTVSVKRYHFNKASQVFAVGSNITDADFIANAPFSREDLEPEFK